MAIQKTYLDEVLETSSYCNRWLAAAWDLEKFLCNSRSLTYKYWDEMSTIECESNSGERFLIIFSWNLINGKRSLCVHVKTYASIIDAQVTGNIPFISNASSITTAMTVGKLINSIEQAIHNVYLQGDGNIDVDCITTSKYGTGTLACILKMLIGKVYFNNFNHDWSTP